MVRNPETAPLTPRNIRAGTRLPWVRRGSWYLCILVLLPLSLQAAAPDKIDYNFHIKPILSDRCYACHGPDEEARKAGLRLDTREGAFATLEDGLQPIQPGQSSQSKVYQKITAEDPDNRMPPPESKLKLSPEEIELIRRWIEQGAEWKRHWSFIPLKDTPIPRVQNTDWPRNPIDHFVLAGLEREGLAPSPPATKEQLIRRLSFDLTGLPPTLPEIDAFLADDTSRAYEKVIDRLLASPRYGERMAIDWLDVARYADTHGYQADRYRSTWPWRDWVIESFNNNLSFDRFITWQLAGDLLPNPTQDQRLATTFNRLHMQTEEGGSVPEEFRVEYVVDRVNTTASAFMGLTLQCARCHDHKYDPISQQDYYQLFSFFNNIDESGQTTYFTDATPVPTLLLSEPETDSRLRALREEIAEKEHEVLALRETARLPFERWLSDPPASPAMDGLIGDFPFDELDKGKFINRADAEKPGLHRDHPEVVSGKVNNAIRLNGENGVDFKELAVFSRTDPFSFSLWIQCTQPLENAVIFHRSKAGLDAGNRGYEMYLNDGRVSLMLAHMWPNNSIKVTSRERLPVNEWVHLTMTYDGSSRADGVHLYWNGQPAEVDVVRDNLYKDILYGRTSVDLTIGERFRDHGFKGGMIDEFKIFERALTAPEAAHLSGHRTLSAAIDEAVTGALSSDERERLLDYFLANYYPKYRDYRDDLHALRVKENELVNPIPEIMTMKEMATPRPTHLLKRGAYDQPGQRVYPDTPDCLPEFGRELPPNRLGLAEWLVDPENPLTARVIVNRYWQMHFGAGLVRTPGDFGSQGDLPTHPALLDWLAQWFIDSGWDLKALHRLMVDSATYRQSSVADADLLKRDPDNTLLARGPSYRLPAELIRDNALAAGGLLVDRIGGPSVKPYQPEGLWKEKSGATYEPDTGSGLYRRSLYTFWKRTSPPPAMMAFDASERNICQLKRQRTRTPSQALVLLNDPQFVEAARKIGERMLREGGDSLEQRLTFAFRLLTSRRPQSAELDILNRLYHEQRELFEKDPQAARDLLNEGESDWDHDLDAVSLAASTQVAGALLSYDGTTMKR